MTSRPLPLRLALLTALLLFAPLTRAQLPTGWELAGNAREHYLAGVQTIDGRPTAFLRASSDPGKGFATLSQVFSAKDYRGKRLRLSGELRTESAGAGQLWMRIDDDRQRVLGFDNMQERSPHGSTPRHRYEIVLDVPADAQLIAMGFNLVGVGEVWADSLRLEVVDPSVPLTGLRNHLPVSPQNLDFSR